MIGYIACQSSSTRRVNLALKGMVHFEMNFWCFRSPQGHPRCRCLCFHSVFNFDIFRSNRSCH